MVTISHTNFGNHKFSVLTHHNKKKEWPLSCSQLECRMNGNHIKLFGNHKFADLTQMICSCLTFPLIFLCQNWDFVVTKIGIWWGYQYTFHSGCSWAIVVSFYSSLCQSWKSVVTKMYVMWLHSEDRRTGKTGNSPGKMKWPGKTGNYPGIFRKDVKFFREKWRKFRIFLENF